MPTSHLSPMCLARHPAGTICQTRLDALDFGYNLKGTSAKVAAILALSAKGRCSQAVMGNHVCCAEELLQHRAQPQQRDAPKLHLNLCRARPE